MEHQFVLLSVDEFPLDENGDPLVWSIPRTVPDMFEDPEGFIQYIYESRTDGALPERQTWTDAISP